MSFINFLGRLQSLRYFFAILTFIIILKSNFFQSVYNYASLKVLTAGFIVQVFVVVSLYLSAFRHVILVRKRVRSFLNIAFRAMILSQGLNLILPARLSELLKATYMRKHAKVPLSLGLSAIVVERMIDALIFALLGLLSIAHYTKQESSVLAPAISLILVIAVICFVQYPKLATSLLNAIPFKRLAIFLDKTFQHFSSALGSQLFWQALWIGSFTWIVSYFNIFIFLELAGSFSVGAQGALLVFVATTLGGAISVLPGGIGTYEAAAVISLRSLGYNYEEALALSLALHTAQFALPLICTIFIMLTERLGISSLVCDLRNAINPEDDPKINSNE